MIQILFHPDEERDIRPPPSVLWAMIQAGYDDPAHAYACVPECKWLQDLDINYARKGWTFTFANPAAAGAFLATFPKTTVLLKRDRSPDT